MRSTLRLLGLAPIALVASMGCTSPAASETVGSSEGEWVQNDTFARMSDVVRNINYLSFRYKADGCYARALYMSMELASQGLESNTIFAFAKPGTTLVVGPTQWRYHETPLLNVGPDADHLTPMVIDPAIAKTPITMGQWVQAMGKTLGNPDAPTMLMVPGSLYAPNEAQAEVEYKNKDMPDFAHLPKFKASDVQNACQVIYRYLNNEPLGERAPVLENAIAGGPEYEALDIGDGSLPAVVQAKRDRLVSRTTQLIGELTNVDKLDADTTFSEEKCRRGF